MQNSNFPNCSTLYNYYYYLLIVVSLHGTEKDNIPTPKETIIVPKHNALKERALNE